jgi:hypothetical protein
MVDCRAWHVTAVSISAGSGSGANGQDVRSLLASLDRLPSLSTCRGITLG